MREAETVEDGSVGGRREGGCVTGRSLWLSTMKKTMMMSSKGESKNEAHGVWVSVSAWDAAALWRIRVAVPARAATAVQTKVGGG